MIRHACIGLAVVTVALVLTIPSATATPRSVNCGSLSVGPAAPVRSTTGATCLLRAYQRHCSAATYLLSRFGVDAVATESFRVVSRQGHCQVAVTTAFRVVPQRLHTSGRGYCATLRRAGGDIAAVGCTGVGLAKTFSLTGRRT